VPPGSTFETHIVSGTWLALPYSWCTRFLIKRAAARFSAISCTVTLHPFLFRHLRSVVMVNARLGRWRSVPYNLERCEPISRLPKVLERSDGSA
jgi:hypothetical protein